MKKFYFLLILLCINIAVTAQQRPCAAKVYRQFDFWIGEWEVFDTSGKKAGDSKISVLLDSCIILEEWASATVVKGIRYAGKSYNTYNAAKKSWQQYWVDNAAGVTEYFNGHYKDKKMILETDNEKQANDTFKIQRMTFHDLGRDKVRQHGENSVDGGKTWTTDFDLEYRRKK
ncbi:MAG: hypothetical protein V4685_00825 [Bacteroidota bacterium]